MHSEKEKNCCALTIKQAHLLYCIRSEIQGVANRLLSVWFRPLNEKNKSEKTPESLKRCILAGV